MCSESVYVKPQWGLELFKGVRDLYRRQELCDTILHAGGREFLCHRIVLAAASSYFHAMFAGGFSERGQTVIQLNEVQGTSLSMVLEFIYNGNVSLTGETAQDLFVAAHMLQLSVLEGVCADYMLQHVEDSNCVTLLTFAGTYNCSQLAHAARSHIQKRFSTILESSEFLSLAANQVAEVLSLRDVDCKDVTEHKICEAALRWLQHDSAQRHKFAYKVLRHVRLTRLQPEFYESLKVNSLLRGSPRMATMFEQVEYIRAHPDRWHEVDLVLEERQWPLAREELMVVFCGVRATDKAECLGSHDGFIDDYMTRNDWPTELQHPRLAAVKGGEELYLLQGNSKAGGGLYRFSTTMGFSSRAPLRTKKSHFSVVHLDHELYVIGGSHKGSLSASVEKYSTKTGVWSSVAPMPYKLRACCAVSYRGRIYVFGGQKASRSLAKKEATKITLCYDPGRDSWTELNGMATARVYAGCAIYRGKIYVMGGVSKHVGKRSLNQTAVGVDNTLGCCEIYDPHKDTWRPGPALPKGLGSPGVVKFLGTIYVLGGVSQSGANYDVYELNEEGSGWHCQKGALNHAVTPTMQSAYTTVLLRSAPRDNLDFSTYSESSLDSTGTSQIGGSYPGSSDTDSSLDGIAVPLHSSTESTSSDEW